MRNKSGTRGSTRKSDLCECIGESLVVNPRGENIGHGSASEEDLVVAEIDLELMRAQCRTWPLLNDRRPEGRLTITRNGEAPIPNLRPTAN